MTSKEEYAYEDEEVPLRKPIGWNYQSINYNDESEANGNAHDTSDEIEVLEVVEVIQPKVQSRLSLPKSSTRKEIRTKIRNATQSKVDRFFNNADIANIKDSTNKETDLDEQSNSPVRKVKKVKLSTTEQKKNVLNGHSSITKKEGYRESKKSEVIHSSKNKEADKDDNSFIENIFSSPVKRNVNYGQEEPVAHCSKYTTYTPAKLRKDSVPNEAIHTSSTEIKLKHGSDTEGETLLDREDNISSESSRNSVEKFISRWEAIKKLESSDDLKIKEKLWKNYYLSHSSYTHSRKFMKLMQKGVDKLNEKNLYLIIKEIIDNLKQFKDVPYMEKKMKEKEKDNQEKEIDDAELSSEERKRKRRLRKIEREMIKLSKKIKELEEAEVDFSDEENSSYLLQERLKVQFMRLDEYYCKTDNCITSTGRPVEKKFKYSGSRYPEINRRITAWVNKHKQFPEYCDILDLVRKVSKMNNLPLKPEAIRVQAQNVFIEVGKILKSRRLNDDMFAIEAYAGEDPPGDPAGGDVDLDDKLRKNLDVAHARLEKVFQYYSDKEIESKRKEAEIAAKKLHRRREDTSSEDEKEKPESRASKCPDGASEPDNNTNTINEDSDSDMNDEVNSSDESAESEIDVDIKPEMKLEEVRDELCIKPEDEEFGEDEFDVEIQEILMIDHKKEEEEYEEELEEEDVLLAESPVNVPAESILPEAPEEDFEVGLFNNRTHFKRKAPDDVTHSLIPSKRAATESPEIVELD